MFQCKENTFTSETFLTVIKTSDNTEELQAVKEKVDADIARQRSKDRGGDDGRFLRSRSFVSCQMCHVFCLKLVLIVAEVQHVMFWVV